MIFSNDDIKINKKLIYSHAEDCKKIKRIARKKNERRRDMELINFKFRLHFMNT